MVEHAIRASDALSCDGISDNVKKSSGFQLLLVNCRLAVVRGQNRNRGWKLMESGLLVESGLNAAEISSCSLAPTSILPRSRKSVKYHFALTGTNLSTSSANIISCSRQVLLINQNWRLVNLEAYDQGDDPTWTTLVLDWACATVMLLSHFRLIKLNWPLPVQIDFQLRSIEMRGSIFCAVASICSIFCSDWRG